MITFYDSADDEQLGTLELVDGKLKATGHVIDIVGPPQHRRDSDETIYAYYRSWSNGYSYSKEESSSTE